MIFGVSRSQQAMADACMHVESHSFACSYVVTTQYGIS